MGEDGGPNLLCFLRNGSVTAVDVLGMAVHNNVFPRRTNGAAWEYATMKDRAQTVMVRRTACYACFCSKWNADGIAVEFRANLLFEFQLHILISRELKGEENRKEREGIYGHEQLHVQNTLNTLRRYIDPYIAWSERSHWPTETACKADARAKRNDLYRELLTARTFAFVHAPENGFTKPENVKPYDPIGGMPSPTDRDKAWRENSRSFDEPPWDCLKELL